MRIKRMLAKALLFAYVLITFFMCCNIVSDSIATEFLHVKRVCNSQFDWLFIADACKGIWPTINRNIFAAGEN